MDFFDYYNNINQNFFTSFGNTSQTTAGKKTSTNLFDGFLTPFDEVMMKYLPSSNGFSMGATDRDRPTLMSYLVDQMRAQTDMMMRKIDIARQKADEVSYQIKEKCLSIAFRISDGDNVSDEDLRFLEKNDPELYAHAMLLKKEKEEGK